jgi:hypothetical protein
MTITKSHAVPLPASPAIVGDTAPRAPGSRDSNEGDIQKS